MTFETYGCNQKEAERADGLSKLESCFMLGQVLLFGPRSGETLEEISNINRSKNTVRPELKDLTERGLLREVTKRPLVFSLTAKGRELLDLQEPESF